MTSEWSDQEGQLILKYYGRSPKLGAVEVVFDKVKSCFFVPSNSELPDINCKYERKSIGLKTFAEEEVDALYFASHIDARTSSDRLKAAGVQVYESDVKPDERFLMENFN